MVFVVTVVAGASGLVLTGASIRVEADHMANTAAEGFRFGRGLPGGGACCQKPVGCTMTHEGCLFLSHPWKRSVVFGDSDAPCMATNSVPIDPACPGGARRAQRCTRRKHPESEPHDMQPIGPR